MEKTNQSKLFNLKNTFLLGGIITLFISLCIIFPIESSKSDFIFDLVYTFLTLAIALLLIMLGLMGKHFFKGILFLAGSSIFGYIFFYVAYTNDPFNVLAALCLGVPSGILTALVFLIANFEFFNDKTKYKLLKLSLIHI